MEPDVADLPDAAVPDDVGQACNGCQSSHYQSGAQ
jgi:hypothetical protein